MALVATWMILCIVINPPEMDRNGSVRGLSQSLLLDVTVIDLLDFNIFQLSFIRAPTRASWRECKQTKQISNPPPNLTRPKKSAPHVAKGLHDRIRPQHLQATSLPGKQVTMSELVRLEKDRKKTFRIARNQE